MFSTFTHVTMAHGMLLKKDVRTYEESALSKGGRINTLERKRITFERWCVDLTTVKIKDI